VTSYELRADCANCFGLCCVAPAFSASADFAIDKPAATPCRHLRDDFRCGIHDRLRPAGFPGCAVYDCFGAGQRVAQITFGGRNWRQAPDTPAGRKYPELMFAAFGVMRNLHELLWYLTEALTWEPARPLAGELRDALAATERLADRDPYGLVGLDVRAHQRGISDLLARVSELVRAGAGGDTAELRGADLVGRDLRGTGLVGANLRGAYLIGADLRGADLRLADLIGADLRAADVRGADLRGSLFLTQFQANAARGDRATTLPAALDRPGHWGT
jgi:Pentapeptide repeats (8 copies)